MSAVIENPVLNSPFEEPRRHFRHGEDGITEEIVADRRLSAYLVPVPPPKAKGKQLRLPGDLVREIPQPNQFINQVRHRVRPWRMGGYANVTRVTRRLLEHWTDPERERRLFFCQLEAAETAIYLAEAATKFGDAWIQNDLRTANRDANPELFRVALKMATGSGKTVVMAMLIAWQGLNKIASAQDARFSDAFLIVTPGITIRDRLRVLLPADPQNYYRLHDLVPRDLIDQLGHAKIVITSFHAFQPREKVAAGRLTKAILGGGESGAFTETPGETVRRVCRELGNRKNVVAINDEAHHCYRRRDGETVQAARAAGQVEQTIERALTGEERREAEKREEEARVWISGIEAVKEKLGLRAVYDLSATPFFLRGSGYTEGTLFPWVVSDFSLIDAIESGIVKVPRVPIEDNTMAAAAPVYRYFWPEVREGLPKAGRSKRQDTGEPKLPVQLEAALQSLYGNYERYYHQWQAHGQGTPPVFIVVCNNTSVSKLVFDHVAGWEKTLEDGLPVVVPGRLPLFSNVADGRWLERANTILVDSEQLESGTAMSDDFKKIAAREIEDFKADYRRRFPGRDVEQLTDEDLLREVMNTVGKPGKLGEQVRCVVSVSMLTEGWDANTVTHILGVRAFGTQLLCEQVVGRGLRRMSYATEKRQLRLKGKTVEFDAFPVEYAEVYGVPFRFIPTAGGGDGPPPQPTPTRVRALEERIEREIRFPRLLGYRYELPTDRLEARFTEDSRYALSTEEIATRTRMGPIFGAEEVHTLDELKTRREQEVAFWLARDLLQRYFQDPEQEAKPWLFPQLARIAQRWLRECLTCKSGAFPQMLLLVRYGQDAADRIYQAIAASKEGERVLKPILYPYDTVGSTRWVDFETTRPTYETSPEKCHISHVVCDTESWEQKMAQTLEAMPEVTAYAKNHNLNFTIPYTIGGEERRYVPDFLARMASPDGESWTLILEVSGAQRRDKAAKVAAARNLWVPAVNNHGGFGRWGFLEISDPWDAEGTIRGFLAETRRCGAGVG